MSSLVPSGLSELVGLWVGLLLSLMIFSTLLRDNGLARLAQHILVGAAFGYLVVLIGRDLLWEQMVAPLWRAPTDHPLDWVPMGLLLLLLAAGLFRMKVARPGRIAQWLFAVGALPVALMLGFGAAAGAVGVIQGTLAPQFLRAAATGLPRDGTTLALVSGLMTLLITSGVLIHLRGDPMRGLRGVPEWLQWIVSTWAGIGKRALWLAAGVIFARLIASRLSLLIAQIDFLLDTLQRIALR